MISMNIMLYDLIHLMLIQQLIITEFVSSLSLNISLSSPTKAIEHVNTCANCHSFR